MARHPACNNGEAALDRRLELVGASLLIAKSLQRGRFIDLISDSERVEQQRRYLDCGVQFDPEQVGLNQGLTVRTICSFNAGLRVSNGCEHAT
jgi:hypothetical protein